MNASKGCRFSAENALMTVAWRAGMMPKAPERHVVIGVAQAQGSASGVAGMSNESRSNARRSCRRYRAARNRATPIRGAMTGNPDAANGSSRGTSTRPLDRVRTARMERDRPADGARRQQTLERDALPPRPRVERRRVASTLAVTDAPAVSNTASSRHIRRSCPEHTRDCIGDMTHDCRL